MHVSTRFRGLLRFWRVGAALSGVIVVALVAMLIIGRNSDASVSNGKSALITNTNALPPTTAPVAGAATTAAGRAVPAAGVAVPAGSAVAGSVASRTSSGGAPSDASTILNAPLPPQAIDQKIIRNGSLTITAKDVAGTQGAIWNLAGEFGGVVITSNTSGANENVRADIAFRVPSERFRDAMDRVRQYAVKVEKEQSSAQDVTEEYVDLQARQRTLEATTLQLQTLLGKATTVDDTLKVQTQLNSVQSDLERIKGKVIRYAHSLQHHLGLDRARIAAREAGTRHAGRKVEPRSLGARGLEPIGQWPATRHRRTYHRHHRWLVDRVPADRRDRSPRSARTAPSARSGSRRGADFIRRNAESVA